MSTSKVNSVCICTQPLAFGGGVGREVELIADHFLRNGADVHLLHASNIRKDLFYHEEFEPYNEQIPEKVISVRTFFPIHFASSLLFGLASFRKIPEADLNLVIGSSVLEATPFLFAGRPFTCLVASTAWDEWRTVMKLTDLSRPLSWMLRLVNTLCMPLTRLIERACYKRAHRVIAISEHTRENVVREFSMDDVRVLNPPVDDKCFTGSPRSFDGPYILSIGRLDPRKDLRTLIGAFSKSGYGGKLVIAGTGPELEKLKRLAAEHKVRDRIVFTGFVSDDTKYSLLQYADAFLLTSEQEGFGITVLESMACRTPVISTRCGGPEDVVEDGVTGFLADVGDVTKISSLIDRVTSESVEQVVENAFRKAQNQKVECMVNTLSGIHFEGESSRTRGNL